MRGRMTRTWRGVRWSFRGTSLGSQPQEHASAAEVMVIASLFDPRSHKRRNWTSPPSVPLQILHVLHLAAGTGLRPLRHA
jgi:hypothetical protein